MSRSPNLSLPYIQPAQAQKHVTHNLAIERLDALVQLSVTELHATELPPAPFDGQVIGIGTGARGGIEGQDGKLAYFTNGAWMYVEPRNGFKAWVEAMGSFYVYRDGDWQVLLTAGGEAAAPDRLDGLGLNTGWNATNRLSVASDATLLSHEGAGHRVKVNKAAPGDTASLLFQSDFSGRAEIGLAGDDDFALKVSADGQDWTTALSVSADTGETAMGGVRAASYGGDGVQAARGDTTPGRLMRADWGYGPGNLLGVVGLSGGGQPTGAVIERGENANGRYTRLADGTQICTFDKFQFSGVNSGSMRSTWTFPAPFAVAPDYVGLTMSLKTANWSDSSLRSKISTTGLNGDPSATSAELGLYSAAGGITVTVSNNMVIAVGRWA